jgi:hypothetical protein
MVATWRPEYGELMKPLGELLGKDITVGFGGYTSRLWKKAVF